MISGMIVGIVEKNVDPEKMNRILVSYPVASEEKVQSAWARICSPMAGPSRGLVMIPDIGTEVVLAFSYQSLFPYVLGAVYNGGEDLPEPYHNDDENDDKRVFWSRNDHMVLFDDTEGAEKVQIGAQATVRLQVDTGVIHQTLDSSEKTITEYCDGDTIWEAEQTISIKCKDFKLVASGSIDISAGTSANLKSTRGTTIQSAGEQRYSAAQTAINPGAVPADPCETMPTPAHKHPPSKS